MDELVKRIVHKVTTSGNRLSVVKNPDGFLYRADTQQRVREEAGLLLLPVDTGMKLRLRYEQEDRCSEEKVCYLMENENEILPDIKEELYDAKMFALSDMLPACNEMEVRNAQLSFNMASYVFSKRFVFDLSAEETRRELDEARERYGVDSQEMIAELKAIRLNWEDSATMDKIARIAVKAIDKSVYEEIEVAMDVINEDFQKFVDEKYYSSVNSTSAKKPKMVHKILPHIFSANERNDKVALVVVDGMAYWQYLILDRELEKRNIVTKRDVTLAWLPSITKLSRQAIFRGDVPREDYNQGPHEESKLWMNYCTATERNAKRMAEYEVSYTHGGLLPDDYNIKRLALVDVALDDKMHASSDNRDLLSLTKNWAEEAAEDIKALYNNGYKIYITTDHGNVLARKWRALTQKERTMLYEKESRGSRHLIYNNVEYLNAFLSVNRDVEEELMVKNSWAIWRNRKNFSNQDKITHGGAHFWEVVIPFVTIERK